MKLKLCSVAFAASILLAGLAFTSDDAAGRSAGRAGGGFARGGFGRGPMSFGRQGMGFRSHGVPHISRFSGSGSRGRASHAGNFNRGYSAGRYSKGASLGATGSLKGKGINANLAANKPLRQAALSKHNAFFGHSKAGGFSGGWHDRYGHGYGYRWYGAVFWPWFFGDYFSYAFWPWDYYDTFWGYGPDAIMWGAFWPYGEFDYDAGAAYDGAYSGDIYGPYRRRAAAATTPADPAAAAETCAGFAPGVSDLPIQQLEKIVDASEEQRAALEDLKAAVAKASDILKSSCSSDTPLTPVSRLDAMERRLQAMAQANEAIKEPLIRLYGLFTDAQKERLEALGKLRERREPPARAKDVKVAELCTSQAEFTSVPAEQIARTIELTEAQKQELEKLRAASAQASEGLKTACPVTVPSTLDGRLDAAQQRVTALIQAVGTVRPAVRDFYASLTDEQKAALSIQPANRG